LSSFAVSGGRAITQIRRTVGDTDREVCIALDAQTGAELWAANIGPAQYDSGVGMDDGPRSTPTIKDGRVYVLSSQLGLRCLNAATGAQIWSKDLRALYGGSNIGWQSAASPIVVGDLLFVNANTASQTLFAFRASDGSVAWRTQTAPMTQATPISATIEGVQQVVFAAQNGLVALALTNGSLLWKASYPFRYDTSIGASPVVWSNLVFLSANYSMGSFAARITVSNSTFLATPIWTNATYRAHWMTPVCHEGYLYGMFGSSYTSPFKCIDLRTGVQKWSMNGFGRGGTILVDNHLLALSERGDLVLIQPNPNAYTEVARAAIFPGYDPDGNKCWNVPAVCDGRIYARSTASAVCLDIAVPSLRMLPPKLLGGNKLQLCVGTDSGAALDPVRLARIQLRSSHSLDTTSTHWVMQTNQFTLSGGLVYTDVAVGSGVQFYAVSETP
jgi:outer membrane protein assembly factor BamB